MAVVPVERIISRQRRRVEKGSLLAAAASLLVSAITMWLIRDRLSKLLAETEWDLVDE